MNENIEPIEQKDTKDMDPRLKQMMQYSARNLSSKTICPKCRSTADLKLTFTEEQGWVYYFQCGVCFKIKGTPGTENASKTLNRLAPKEIFLTKNENENEQDNSKDQIEEPTTPVQD